MFNPRAAIADSIARKRVDIPPYPAIALRLNKLLRSDTYNLDQLAELVSLDPGLVVRLLRMANTSAASRGTKVDSLNVALGRLGARKLTRLALAAALSDQACADGALASLKYLTWRKSLMCAFVAQALADETQADDAFLCGLLRGLGRTIVLAYLERAAREHAAAALLPASAWLSLVGSYEAQIGVQVARRWGLPELLCDVLAGRPDGPADVTELVGLVELADAIVDSVEESTSLDHQRLRQLLPDPGDYAALCRLLPTLPELVESLGKPDQTLPALSHPLLIEPDTALLPEPLYDVTFDVVMVSGQRSFRYRAMKLGAAGCIAEGTQRIPENWFARMELRIAEAPFDVWSKVTRCARHGGKVQIAFQPVALTHLAEARWRELVARVSPSPA